MKTRDIMLLSMIVLSGMIYSQTTDKKISRRISLVEEFTAEDFKVPNKVMFYSGGNYNLETNYQSLFKKLNKKFRKEDKNYVFRYNRDAKLPIAITSFEELNPQFKNSEYDALCIVLAGNHTMSQPDSQKGNIVTYVDKKPEYYYDFYLILVEANTNKVLLKRKYNVIDTDRFKNDNKELVNAIVSEFKD